jgi:hypothetical protein
VLSCQEKLRTGTKNTRTTLAVHSGLTVHYGHTGLEEGAAHHAEPASPFGVYSGDDPTYSACRVNVDKKNEPRMRAFQQPPRATQYQGAGFDPIAVFSPDHQLAHRLARGP